MHNEQAHELVFLAELSSIPDSEYKLDAPVLKLRYLGPGRLALAWAGAKAGMSVRYGEWWNLVLSRHHQPPLPRIVRARDFPLLSNFAANNLGERAGGEGAIYGVEPHRPRRLNTV